MKARIYRPSRNVMQSGRGKVKQWVLEYEIETARVLEPLMGWTSSGDTLNQIKMKFESKDSAIAFAEGKGLEYSVQKEHKRRVRPRNYIDNFKYVPPEG